MNPFPYLRKSTVHWLERTRDCLKRTRDDLHRVQDPYLLAFILCCFYQTSDNVCMVPILKNLCFCVLACSQPASGLDHSLLFAVISKYGSHRSGMTRDIVAETRCNTRIPVQYKIHPEPAGTCHSDVAAFEVRLAFLVQWLAMDSDTVISHNWNQNA